MEQLIINMVTNYYTSNKAIKNLLRYIVGKGNNEGKEHVRFSSAKGLSFDYKKAASQLIITQKALGKTDGRRVYHMVVSFPESFDENRDGKLIDLVACSVADVLFVDYQTFYAVHTSTDNLHIHFAFNAVSYRNGKKWHKSPKEFREFREYILGAVNRTLIKYGYEPMTLKKDSKETEKKLEEYLINEDTLEYFLEVVLKKDKGKVMKGYNNEFDKILYSDVLPPL